MFGGLRPPPAQSAVFAGPPSIRAARLDGVMGAQMGSGASDRSEAVRWREEIVVAW
jgi:hypothetical protein